MTGADAVQEEFRLERRDRTAVLTLCQPKRLNPFSVPGFTRFAETVERLSGDPEVDVVVITGEGRAFCVGLDLAAVMDFLCPDGGEMEQARIDDMFNNGANRMARALSECRKPTIAALNGIVAGAGVGLALGCDIVLGCLDTESGLPFVPGLGIVPDTGGSWFVTRLAGRARALPAMLTGDPIAATEALAAGLIWKLHDRGGLVDEALILASRLGQGPTHVYPDVRRLMAEAERNDLLAQLEVEREINTRHVNSAHFARRVGDFMNKRAGTNQG